MSAQDQVRALVARYDLDDKGLSTLLGVPESTARKWLDGHREPSAAAYRLIDVFTTLQAIAPEIMHAFVPAPRSGKGRQRNF
jgi:DNA-binding transcriptional regulator YiaG